MKVRYSDAKGKMLSVACATWGLLPGNGAYDMQAVNYGFEPHMGRKISAEVTKELNSGTK